VAYAQAAGEFVALVDADDRWMPEHLARSIRALEASGKDVAYSSVVMFEDETDVLVGIWGPTGQELQDFPHGLFLRNFITPSATVMRRQTLADVGPWNTQYRYCEDLEYWLRCVAAGKSFQHVGGCNCLYRRHANAATNHGGALQEAFAQIVERFIATPGLRTKSCRRFASKAYLRAALTHANSNPLYDPSGDRSRAAGLMFKAWRLRPKRVGHLVKAAQYGLANLVRRQPQSKPANRGEQPTLAAA
jgi:hypothetical protein